MKKISVNKWSKLLEKKIDIPVVTKIIKGQVQDQTLEVEIKTDISMLDRMSFAKNVCEACFDEVDGSYIPYAKDVSFGVYLVNYFTNVDVGKDMGKALRFIKHTDIIHIIEEVAGVALVDALHEEVEDLLWQEQTRRSKSTKAEELFDALTKLVESFSSMADSARGNLEDGSIPELTKIMKAYNNDQEGLVKAILAAQKDNK